MKTIRWKIAQFLEVQWWRNYLSSKDKASYYAWKKDYWLHFLNHNQLSLSEGQLVLDAGCGPAGIFTVLDKNEVVALDPLLEYYEQQLSQFAASDWPWVTFEKGPIETFHTEHKFDLIYCLNAINHVADLDKSLEVLSKVCKPSGRLVLSVDVHRWRFFRWFFGLLPIDILHPHQYTGAEYTTRLALAGFEVQQVRLVKREFFFNYNLIVAIKST